MYVKILKGNTLFEKLTHILGEMQKSNKATLEWVNFQGGTSFRIGFWNMAGGVSSAVFPNKPPKGWVKGGQKYDVNEYIPGKTAAGRDIRKAIDGLPKVSYDTFNEIVGYDPDNATTNKRSFHPGYAFYDDCILMNFADHTTYTPVPYMIEITVTEFKRIQAAHKTDES